MFNLADMAEIIERVQTKMLQQFPWKSRTKVIRASCLLSAFLKNRNLAWPNGLKSALIPLSVSCRQDSDKDLHSDLKKKLFSCFCYDMATLSTLAVNSRAVHLPNSPFAKSKP